MGLARDKEDEAAGHGCADECSEGQPAGSSATAAVQQPHVVGEGIARKEPGFDCSGVAVWIGRHGAAS